MLEQLLFPRADLCCMHLALLGLLGDRLAAANRLQGDLGLEYRKMLRRDRFMVTAPPKG